MNRQIPDILTDLHAARQECERYETQHQMLSEDFFRLYLAGQVEDDPELQMWAGFCKVARRCQQEYETAVMASGLPLRRRIMAVAA
jgi:hypothetical protein